MTEPGERWFAVRCVFEWSGYAVGGSRPFEERVTLWRAVSFEGALSRAEAEAHEHVAGTDPPLRVLDLAQAYELFDAPGDGVEVFSLLRDSDMTASDYLDRYFDTGAERQH